MCLRRNDNTDESMCKISFCHPETMKLRCTFTLYFVYRVSKTSKIHFLSICWRYRIIIFYIACLRTCKILYETFVQISNYQKFLSQYRLQITNSQLIPLPADSDIGVVLNRRWIIAYSLSQSLSNSCRTYNTRWSVAWSVYCTAGRTNDFSLLIVGGVHTCPVISSLHVSTSPSYKVYTSLSWECPPPTF